MKTLPVDGPIQEAIIDDSDYEWASIYRWWSKRGFPVCKIGPLHRLIMSTPNEMVCIRTSFPNDFRKASLKNLTHQEHNAYHKKQNKFLNKLKKNFNLPDGVDLFQW